MLNNYTVIAIVQAKPEQATNLKQALLAVQTESRKESTNIQFHVHQALDNPAIFFLYEQWQSQHAHQQQFTKPYITALAAQLPDLLAAPYQAVTGKEL